jgi:hypothetical protein
MLSKPCGRADRGCKGVITAPGPKTLAMRSWCSVSCAVKARVEAGWRPETCLTADVRRRAGSIGGRIAGDRRKRQSMIRVVAALESLIPDGLKAGLTDAQLRCVKVLLGRGFQQGHDLGYHAGWVSKNYHAARRRARKEAA